ncbi:Serine/threonine-protein kinase PBS1-like protein [Drosera capensis]
METLGVGVVVSVAAALVSVVSLVVAFGYYCYIRRRVERRAKFREGQQNGEKDLTELPIVCEEGIQQFMFKQLHSATGGFSKSNVIGRGAFGFVYRGVLGDGRKVAVKVMDEAGKQGEEEFKAEVELMSRLHSQYLLGLIGYCSDINHKLLVYEFMANGGLQEHLYPADGSKLSSSKLDWKTRLTIALDAAKGLEYLHDHVSPPVIHRDFKSSNILLDKSFHAKVSDFGLAKLGSAKVGGHVSTRVLGTQGYVAPEYALTGHLTTKSDVYSYGVVLLELLTGRLPFDVKRSQAECALVSWALPQLIVCEKVIKIIDPALDGQYLTKEVMQVAAIAAMCVQLEADYRPLMADVVQSLAPFVRTRRSTSKLDHTVGSDADSKSPMLLLSVVESLRPRSTLHEGPPSYITIT